MATKNARTIDECLPFGRPTEAFLGMPGAFLKCKVVSAWPLLPETFDADIALMKRVLEEYKRDVGVKV